MAKSPANTQTTANDARRRAYSVKGAARELSLSVAQVYVLLGRGELRGKSSGTRIFRGRKASGRLLIPGKELDRYLASLPDAVINEQRPKHPRKPEPQAAERRATA